MIILGQPGLVLVHRYSYEIGFPNEGVIRVFETNEIRERGMSLECVCVFVHLDYTEGLSRMIMTGLK